MHKSMAALLVAATSLVGGPSGVYAQDTDLQKMQAELAQMRAELAQMRAQQQGNWLTDARREEIKGLIDEVLADAQKRGSLTGSSVLAGIDEKGKIFLKSDDGQFNINFNGQVQFRYIWNNLDHASGTRSDSLSGFQVRRIKFGMKGEVGDGWGFKLLFATERGTGPGGGNVFTEDVYITKDLGDGWELLVGTNKLPFARQEIISSTQQVGVDRGLVTEFFTLNRADQVAISHATDDFQYVLALSDGGNADFTEFNADVSNDFALTGRIDWLAIGKDWGAAKNEFGGVKDDVLFVGAAIHYEVAEGGGAAPVADAGLAWTLDTLYKTGNLGLTAALFGNHTDNNGAADTDQYGLYTQAVYQFASKWDVFGRWEWIDDDNVDAGGGGELEAITVGVNHHFSKLVKFTADVVWLYDGSDLSSDGNFINGGETGSGLGLSSVGFNANQSHDDQVVLRMQLQLLF